MSDESTELDVLVDESGFEPVVEESKPNERAQFIDEDAPSPDSDEWQDWVLSKLRPDELAGQKKDRPRAAGLLRVTRLIYGDVDHGMTVHAVNQEYAAVTCHVVTPNGTQYLGAAECHAANTDDPYRKYPLATAQTRGIGRACKFALGIPNVLTAEETSEIADLTKVEPEGDRTEGGITATQVKFIDLACKKLNIDVKKAVTQVVGPHDTIDDLSHQESHDVQSQLDEWKRAEDQPYADLGPYDENWRSEFGGKN